MVHSRSNGAGCVALFLLSSAFSYALAQDTFSVIVIPDTQYYSEKDPVAYEKQMTWIVDNKDKARIKFAIHMGDITQSGDKDRDKRNEWIAEWEHADRAHQILDKAGVRYSVLPGNHDYPRKNSDVRHRDLSLYNRFFGSGRFTGGWHEAYGSGNENNVTFFEHNKLMFMVVSLEYAPRKDSMCWADQQIRKHADRRVIVATHCYQTLDGRLKVDCPTGNDNMLGATSPMIWEELVQRNPNVFMILSGHVGDSQHIYQDRDPLPSVVSILTDFQWEPGRNSTNPFLHNDFKHGNGWLRKLEFDTKAGQIRSTVHSALDANQFYYINDGDREYSKDPGNPDHQFTIPYNMAGAVPTLARPRPGLSRFGDRAINTASLRNQLRPRVAAGKSGDWVSVWQDDGSGAAGVYQIYARTFDADGCQRHGSFTVNTGAKGQQKDPDVAMDAGGGFVVVWADDSNANGSYQIKARGFNANGTQRFAQRTINANAKGQQKEPVVAADSAGNFVVVWIDDSDKNGVYQIRMRGFKADGSPRFGQQTVNTVTAGQQKSPAIAMDGNGNFIVVWEDDSNANGVYQVKMRGFKPDGTQLFADKTVNTVAAGEQRQPAVAMDAKGNFVVAWADDSNKNGVYQVKMRGFKSDGTERFDQRTVNVKAEGQQKEPSIAMAPDGKFVVAFADSGDNQFYQIKARRYDSNGVRLLDTDGSNNSQQTVNTNARGQQRRPHVTLQGGDRFIVAWEDDLEKNDYWELIARGCNFDIGCAPPGGASLGIRVPQAAAPRGRTPAP